MDIPRYALLQRHSDGVAHGEGYVELLPFANIAELAATQQRRGGQCVRVIAADEEVRAHRAMLAVQEVEFKEDQLRLLCEQLGYAPPVKKGQ